MVAGAPSSLRHAGLTSSYSDFTQPAWLRQGKPLPFLPGKMPLRTGLSFFRAWVLRRPLRQRGMFARSLGDAAASTAAIEVERIAGPVLLVSGGADQLWPSDVYARCVLDRLTEHGGAPEHRHLSYPDAGHFVCFPYAVGSLPPMVTLNPYGSLTIDFGGSAAGNEAAGTASWREILAFLGRWATTSKAGAARTAAATIDRAI